MNHESLLARLAEAEETLQALRTGAVDALVVRGAEGDQVYTLQGAGEPYRNLVEQMREGAVVLSRAGDIVYSNARFAALTGQPLEVVLGAQIGCFIAEPYRGDFNELVRSGSGVRRSRLLCADGTSLEIYLSLTTTLSATGAGTLSLIVTDLTELLQARSERDRAERDSHTKDEFLAMLSHELRNPLGVIRTAAVLLDHTGADGAAARAREVIERQVGHLSRLIEDLLDVERVTSGKIRLDRHPLELAQAVRQTVATFTANAGLDRHIDLRTEPLWIDGDAVRLEQVVANIVTNAVKYTPSGGHIEVSLSAEGDDAVLSVTDTGFGIPPDLLPTIFDMFVQGERTLDRAQGGLGIGLTLVRRLVELHGGTVNASSGGAGHGSTFTVRLPQVRGMSVPGDGDTSSAFDRKAPRRVLLIEDHRDARELFRMVLELAGHRVSEAENGDRGLELLNTEQPDVAVIDIGLPGIDGYEVARRIRASENGREMLLLALTGYGLPRDYERSAESGFDHHLVKPVNPYDLARLVEAHQVSAGEEIPA